MVLRKLNQPLPIKLATKNFPNTLGTLPVRILRAAGQQQIKLEAGGERRRCPLKGRRRDGLRQGGSHAGKLVYVAEINSPVGAEILVANTIIQRPLAIVSKCDALRRRTNAARLRKWTASSSNLSARYSGTARLCSIGWAGS